MNFISWNINGVSNKLSSEVVYNYICKFDVIFLCEVKSNLNFHVPGYRTFFNINAAENANTGGVALLIRNCLLSLIKSIDIAEANQIWFEFIHVPNVIFGGIYVYPSNCLYYDDNIFAICQANILSNNTSQFVLFGDWNSRIGKNNWVHLNNSVRNQTNINYSYSEMVDPLIRPNKNGKLFMNFIHNCSIFPINGLKSDSNEFMRKLTFRRANNWISEIDYVLISPHLFNYISSFCIDSNVLLPSNHAIISFKLNIPLIDRIPTSEILQNANHLFNYDHIPTNNTNVKRKLNSSEIDIFKFSSILNNLDTPEILNDLDNIENSMNELNETLYTAAANAKVNVVNNSYFYANNDNRWHTVLSKDMKSLWRAINWNGKISFQNETVENTPSNSDFVEHFSSSLNSTDVEPIIQMHHDIPVDTNTIITHGFNVDEVETVVKKPKDSVGPNGFPYKLLKHIPLNWLFFITHLLSFIYLNSYSPDSWLVNKFIPIYKKGLKNLSSNYRGISVMNSIAKIYDTLILNRLKNWFVPLREQAGAQNGRGCIEFIVTLRMMINYSKKKKKKLYLLFVDYSSAYDKVPRKKLLELLVDFGCPSILVAAIASLYKATHLILGKCTFSVNTGVRQGAPSSGFLFCIYVEKFIRMLRYFCPSNGFLAWLHCLCLMDDKIIIATNASDFQFKLNLLYNYCNDSGMKINLSKTKCLIINAHNDELNTSFTIGNDAIEYAQSYLYLGSYFTADGSIVSSLKLQAQAKEKEINKFIIFNNTNKDYPLWVKMRVLDSCIVSSITYGCESWLCQDIACMNSLYMKAIKSLLGVRHSTPNDTCLMEIGYPTLIEYVRYKQFKFYNDHIVPRQHLYNCDPLSFVYDLCLTETPSIVKFFNHLTCPTFKSLEDIKNSIHDSNRTKFQLYLSLNPNLNTHSIYCEKHKVPEYQRLCFTRLRLSSHKLKIETGRWKTPPTPRDQRICQCGPIIQDEMHIIENCPLSQNVRDEFDDINFETNNLLNQIDKHKMCLICYKLLSIYNP